MLEAIISTVPLILLTLAIMLACKRIKQQDLEIQEIRNHSVTNKEKIYQMKSDINELQARMRDLGAML